MTNQKPLIYCVDDDASIRSLYEEALTLGGFVCRTFEDGTDFYDALSECRPDLIILDIMMPGEDGMSLLSRLQSGKYRSIPVILVSAKSGETDIVKGLNLGSCDYIVKPFGVMELIARIKANIRKVETATIYSYKDIAIDPGLHEIKVGSENVKLTPKEYDLLVYLVNHAGQVVSKEQILSEVWDYGEVIETRTMDIYVSRLRAKLKNSSAHIETIHSVGLLFQ